jgi:hypothetical protein
MPAMLLGSPGCEQLLVFLALMAACTVLRVETPALGDEAWHTPHRSVRAHSTMQGPDAGALPSVRLPLH